MIQQIDIDDWIRSDSPIRLSDAKPESLVETVDGTKFWLQNVPCIVRGVFNNKILGDLTQLSPYVTVYQYAPKNK